MLSAQCCDPAGSARGFSVAATRCSGAPCTGEGHLDMNRFGYRCTSTAGAPTLARGLFATALTLVFFVVASVFGALLLAGAAAVALVFGARLWWLRRRAGRQPPGRAGRTLDLSESDYEVLSGSGNECRQDRE